MSSISYLDVSYMFKRKIIAKLMSTFQVELSALMEDAGYKALKPEEQMFAISELTHWWSLWFQQVPEPSREITNDFCNVVPDDLSTEDMQELINPKVVNWYAYLLQNAVRQPNT